NLSLDIRNSIEQKVFNELSIDESRKLSNELLVSELKRFYSMGKKFDDTIIIAHSNRQVQEYNFMVKRILNTNNKISDYEILPGDKLIVYKNYYSDDLTLLNGQSVEVVQILNREVIKTSEKEDVTYLDCQLKYYDYEMEGERVFKAKILNDYVYSPEPELDRKLYNKVFRAVLIKNLEFREIFNELKKTLREIKTSKTEKLVVLRDRYIALKLQISRMLRDNEYFNPLLVKFGYAITCHKAQGSEWDNVIIDMKTLNLVPRNEQYFRWLYTAVTRAKKEVYFINSIDINPFRGMRIGEMKIQKIKLNGSCGYTSTLLSNKAKIVVDSLEEYGFKVLGIDNLQYMDRFLFEYDSKKMQIDLYYNKKGFYTYMIPYVEDEEARKKMEEWIEHFLSQKCFS
ncbi:MAG: ATP-binding domain-containing protein, partial [Candidatus Aenigmatarchaeota archaeon]